MVKFLKKLNFREEKGVPYYANEELEEEINAWVKKSGLRKGSFGIILRRLNFQLDHTVYLSKSSGDDYTLSLNYSYGSTVTDECSEENKIVLLGPEELEFSKSGFIYGYECVYDKDAYGHVDMDLIYAQNRDKSDDGVSYFRSIIKGEVQSSINIGVKNKQLDQCIGINLIYKDGCNTNFLIDNEGRLKEYLMNLTFPISNLEIYKQLREISFKSIHEYKNIIIRSGSAKELGSTLKYLSGSGSETLEVVSKDKKITYTRKLYYSKVDIVVWDDGYKICFEVDFDEVDNSIKRLDNELGLQDYLMNLTFPISIEEVYKKICEISLGDVSKYSRVVFQCYDNTRNGMITDSVVLSEGNFEDFGMTKNGKTVFINKDGNFIYRTSDTVTDLEVSISSDDKTRCELSAKNGKYMDDYIDSLVPYDISDARKEMEETKKLVRKMFYKDNKGSN